MPDVTPIVLQQIDLDIVPGKTPPIVHVSEYDTGRQILVNLFRDGYPFGSNSIESYTVKVEGSIGKYGFSENASWASDGEGVVVVQLTEAMTAIHGRVWTKIKLIKSSNMQISTCGFWLDCDRAGVEADTVIGASGFEQQIVNAVNDWLDEHPPASGGMSEAFKQALLDCFENVAWINDDGQTYYDALYAALYPPKTLVSISAVFTQGSAVIYDTDSLNTLKQYLTVTATYDDTSTGAVTNYTLSGTLTVGTSVITVLYNGKTTTFDVTVTHSLLPAEYQQVEYIENPSNAYMVTSIAVPLGYKVHGKAYLSAKPSQAVNVCGGDNKGATANWANVSFCCYSATAENYAGTFYGRTNCFDALADLYASPLEFTTVHTASNISISLKNSGGEKSKTVSQSNVVAVDALNVFRASADAPNPFTGRIYLLEVLDTNNQAAARLIPCYRKADNVVGMYDIIGNAFYTSANSTAFTKGAYV